MKHMTYIHQGNCVRPTDLIAAARSIQYRNQKVGDQKPHGEPALINNENKEEGAWISRANHGRTDGRTDGRGL